MFSVSGMIDIGINMDRDLIEDTTRLSACLEASFEELKAAKRKKTKKRPPMARPT